jgi:hypothetical protein
MPTTAAQKRRPHYEQRPLTKSIGITDRDEQILQDVYRYRLLRSRHIIALTPGSNQVVLKRLRRLYDHDCLYRIYEPIHRRKRFELGSKPKIYALSRQGADIVNARDDIRERNAEIGDAFINHVLATADAVVPIEAACRQHNHFRFVDTPELIAQTSSKTDSPFPLRADVPRGKAKRKAGLTPDKYFALHDESRPAGRQRRHFFCEADRGTEPVSRSTLNRQTSIVGKLITYGEIYKQKVHREKLNINSFRVLIVTTSEQRIDNMLKVLKEASEKHNFRRNIFMFTDYASMQSAADIFSLKWTNGDRENITLLD